MEVALNSPVRTTGRRRKSYSTDHWESKRPTCRTPGVSPKSTLSASESIQAGGCGTSFLSNEYASHTEVDQRFTLFGCSLDATETRLERSHSTTSADGRLDHRRAETFPRNIASASRGASAQFSPRYVAMCCSECLVGCFAHQITFPPTFLGHYLAHIQVASRASRQATAAVDRFLQD